MIPLRAAMPRTVRKPTSEPSEITPPLKYAAEHAADQRERQGQEGERRQAPVAEESHAGSGRRRSAAIGRRASRRLWAACRSAYSPSTSGWYPSGNSTARDAAASTSLATEPRSRPSHVGADVDAPRGVLALDLVRRRHDARRRPPRPAARARRRACRSADRAMSSRLLRVSGVLQTFTS